MGVEEDHHQDPSNFSWILENCLGCLSPPRASNSWMTGLLSACFVPTLCPNVPKACETHTDGDCVTRSGILEAYRLMTTE